MDTIKLYFKAKAWLDIYLGYIKRCLFVENNLSDIPDKQEARENLELSGSNVINHKHDSRYLPLIQQETTDRTNADNNVLKTLASETTEHEKAVSKASTQIANTQKSLNASVAAAQQTLFNTENNIQNNLYPLAQKTNLNIIGMGTSGSTVNEFTAAKKFEMYKWTDHPCKMTVNKGVRSHEYLNLADLIGELTQCAHTHRAGCEYYNGDRHTYHRYTYWDGTITYVWY